MNLTLRSTATPDILMDQMNPKIRDAILGSRNAYVVDTALAETGSNIAIVYGALHFHGMYELFRADNKNWKIEKLEALYPYMP